MALSRLSGLRGRPELGLRAWLTTWQFPAQTRAPSWKMPPDAGRLSAVTGCTAARLTFLGFLLSWQFGNCYPTSVGINECPSSSATKQMYDVSEK